MPSPLPTPSVTARVARDAELRSALAALGLDATEIEAAAETSILDRAFALAAEIPAGVSREVACAAAFVVALQRLRRDLGHALAERFLARIFAEHDAEEPS